MEAEVGAAAASPLGARADHLVLCAGPKGLSGRPNGRSGRPDELFGRPDDRSGRAKGRFRRPQDLSGRPDERSGWPDELFARPDSGSDRPNGPPGRPGTVHARPPEGAGGRGGGDVRAKRAVLPGGGAARAGEGVLWARAIFNSERKINHQITKDTKEDARNVARIRCANPRGGRQKPSGLPSGVPIPDNGRGASVLGVGSESHELDFHGGHEETRDHSHQSR
jgi:hypothetical protein